MKKFLVGSLLDILFAFNSSISLLGNTIVRLSYNVYVYVKCSKSRPGVIKLI